MDFPPDYFSPFRGFIVGEKKTLFASAFFRKRKEFKIFLALDEPAVRRNQKNKFGKSKVMFFAGGSLIILRTRNKKEKRKKKLERNKTYSPSK